MARAGCTETRDVSSENVGGNWNLFELFFFRVPSDEFLQVIESPGNVETIDCGNESDFSRLHQ